VYDVERYLRIRSAYAPSFLPDGSLTYLNDATGAAQAWRVDRPLGWQSQVTFGDEPVSFAAASPERDELIYGRDEGGNERTQLYRVDASGADGIRLTDAPDAKHRWGGWSHDGERFAFASNRRDSRVFDIYVQGRDEEEPRLVCETDGWYSVVGWLPGDSALVLREARSNFDHDIYTVDADGGEPERVTDADRATRYRSVNPSPDGEALYISTDEGSDTLYLGRLDLSTGDVETVVDGGDRNVSGVSVDDETGRVVYGRNVEGYTDLRTARIEEGDLRELPTPDLPEGVVGGTSFGPDGDRFAVTVTRRTRNANVYVVDFETGEATRWTDATTAGIPPETFVGPDAVRYDSFDGLEIPALFTTPDAARHEPPYPVIVDIHGGPESQRRPSFSGLRQYLLSSGYALFEPNIRGSTGYGREYTTLDDRRKRMDAVRDIGAALDHLAEVEEADEDRVTAYGGSYGGFVVLAALAEYPERWAAGVDVVGIANFVTFLENTGEWRRALREAEYGSLEEDRDFLERISPVNNAAEIRAPLLVMHGANDPRVPVEEAEQIADEVAEHAPVEKLIFEDEGHGFSKRENRIEAYTTMVEFLDDHVGV
jgi:dipeptidyl aminopeptidase/acylaminoacyl peptidase